MGSALVTTQADDRHYGPAETRPTDTEEHAYAGSATWPDRHISISCRGQSGSRRPAVPPLWGYCSQTGGRLDGQTDGCADGPPRRLTPRDAGCRVKSERSDEINEEGQ